MGGRRKKEEKGEGVDLKEEKKNGVAERSEGGGGAGEGRAAQAQAQGSRERRGCCARGVSFRSERRTRFRWAAPTGRDGHQLEQAPLNSSGLPRRAEGKEGR